MKVFIICNCKGQHYPSLCNDMIQIKIYLSNFHFFSHVFHIPSPFHAWSILLKKLINNQRQRNLVQNTVVGTVVVTLSRKERTYISYIIFFKLSAMCAFQQPINVFLFSVYLINTRNIYFFLHNVGNLELKTLSHHYTSVKQLDKSYPKIGVYFFPNYKIRTYCFRNHPLFYVDVFQGWVEPRECHLFS